MNTRYAGAVLFFLLAGCSASHSANSTSVLPGPNLASNGVAEPLTLSKSHVVYSYPLPHPTSEPWAMATGPDNNVWFTELNASRVGKITPSGAITEYVIPSGMDGYDIAAGSGGTMWFTDYGPNHAIGKITSNGRIKEYPLSAGGYWNEGIAKGPDGNMWFTDPNTNSVGKITPSGDITEYPLLTPGTGVNSITAGPDGNLWFTEQFVGKIGRVTPAGVVTEFTNGSDTLKDIAAGPDGDLYALGYSGIWRVTTGGQITVISAGYVGYADFVIRGPGKQMWMAGSVYLQEFDPGTQSFSPWVDLAPGAGVEGLAVGSDGDVWIASPFGNAILVYEEKVTTIGIRLNGELSFTDPDYGFELGYAVRTSTQTQTVRLSTGESVEFTNFDTVPHSAAFLGNATSNNAPWPVTFTGSTTQSPAGTAIGTTGWATGSLDPNKTSPIYETGLPGFYMIGDQYDYVSNNMRTVIVVH